MKRLLAILLLATPAYAGISVQHKSPPTPLEKCAASNSDLSLTLTAYRDLVRAYRIKVMELEERLAQDPPKVVSQPQAAPARAKKVRKVSRSKGCKKGRTRNSRGICGRWG